MRPRLRILHPSGRHPRTHQEHKEPYIGQNRGRQHRRSDNRREHKAACRLPDSDTLKKPLYRALISKMCNFATFSYQKCVTLPKKDINQWK